MSRSEIIQKKVILKYHKKSSWICNTFLSRSFLPIKMYFIFFIFLLITYWFVTCLHVHSYLALFWVIWLKTLNIWFYYKHFLSKFFCQLAVIFWIHKFFNIFLYVIYVLFALQNPWIQYLIYQFSNGKMPFFKLRMVKIKT